jgi:hypothetical protein
MSTPRTIAESAFRLHAQKRISDKELVHILQECVNIAAIGNGYADEYGLPFPKDAKLPQ